MKIITHMTLIFVIINNQLMKKVIFFSEPIKFYQVIAKKKIVNNITSLNLMILKIKLKKNANDSSMVKY